MRQQVFLGQVSAAGLLTAVAALFYGRVFEGPGWIGPIVGGSLLAGSIAVALARTAMPAVFRILALLISATLFVVLTVTLPTTNFADPSEIGPLLYGSTVDGWRNALAATLPIDTSIPEPLGFVTFVGWLVGAVTGSLLVKSEKPAVPIIPPILFAALSLPLGAPEGPATWFLTVALVISALLFGLVRAVPRATRAEQEERVTEFVGDRMLTERLLAGLPILAVLAVAAPLMASAMPGGPDEPFDPRQYQAEEVESTPAVNPLAEIKARQSSQEEVFLLEVTGGVAATEFDRMTLVALENYNGANWSTSFTYSPTSAELEVLERPEVETLDVRQRVELIAPDLPWIPAGNQPIRVEADDVWYDPESATLLSRFGPSEFAYEVVSRLARPTEEDLREASLDLSDAQYLELPTIPADSPVNGLGDRLTGESDYDRLLALETALQSEFRFLTDEASGTSIGRLEEFLNERAGYRDQFVAAFAVAARQRGFPTRIVVGYRITETTEDNTSRFLETVRSSQYDAWPEVRFSGIGWVPFDPVPASSGAGRVDDDDATRIPEGTPVTPGPTPREAEPEEDDSTDDNQQVVATTVRVLIVAGLFLLLFPIMLLLLVFIIKAVRRRYRENLEDPTDRVLAGWQESKDRLLEAGVEIRKDMTVKEIVYQSRKDLGVYASSPLSTLAPHVTATIYSPNPPTSATADLVWEEVELFDRQLNETRSRLQSTKAKLDPRPLIESV